MATASAFSSPVDETSRTTATVSPSIFTSTSDASLFCRSDDPSNVG